MIENKKLIKICMYGSILEGNLFRLYKCSVDIAGRLLLPNVLVNYFRN